VVRYDSNFAHSSGANSAGIPFSRSVDVSDRLDMTCAVECASFIFKVQGDICDNVSGVFPISIFLGKENLAFLF